MVDGFVPRSLYGWVLFNDIGDPLSNLAPLRGPILNGGPHFHRVVVELSRFQRSGHGGEEKITDTQGHAVVLQHEILGVADNGQIAEDAVKLRTVVLVMI